jgi:hypothetical protein
MVTLFLSRNKDVVPPDLQHKMIEASIEGSVISDNEKKDPEPNNTKDVPPTP